MRGGQWFFFDEWDFIKLSTVDYLTPHLGHWSTIPMLLTGALVRTVGLGSYWPYLVPTVLVHLGLAHVLWRLMLRARVSPWIATALATVMALFGAGSENILWAFQFGFLGAVLLGSIALLVADALSRERFRRLYPAIVALSVTSLLFSGTAIPMLVALGLVSWRRVGILRAVALLSPAVVVYVIWYAYAKLNPTYFMPGSMIGGFHQLFIDVPAFALRMLVGGLDGLTPIPFLGVVLLAGLAGYFVLTLRRLWSDRPVVVAFVAAAVFFALLTAVSRIGFSGDTATSSRYIYLTTALLLPLIGVALTRLGSVNRALQVSILVVLIVTAIYGAATLRREALAQAAIEQETRGILNAAVAIIHDPSLDISISAYADPVYAPMLTVGDLRALVEAGYLPPGDYTAADWATALARLTAVPTVSPQ